MTRVMRILNLFLSVKLQTCGIVFVRRDEITVQPLRNFTYKAYAVNIFVARFSHSAIIW